MTPSQWQTLKWYYATALRFPTAPCLKTDAGLLAHGWIEDAGHGLARISLRGCWVLGLPDPYRLTMPDLNRAHRDTELPPVESGAVIQAGLWDYAASLEQAANG